MYRFFFGLVEGDEIEVVYDQISFSARKGKYLREKKELIRDRKELLLEVRDYAKVEAELRAMGRRQRESSSALPNADPRVAKLQQSFEKQAAMSDFVEGKIAEIEAHSSWSEERKEKEIEKLRQMAEEAALEE